MKVNELKEKLDSCARELHIRCELFCDLESQSESKEHALTRILELLNQNGISMSINRAEIHLVDE